MTEKELFDVEICVVLETLRVLGSLLALKPGAGRNSLEPWKDKG
jgi:hypothetical protein